MAGIIQTALTAPRAPAPVAKPPPVMQVTTSQPTPAPGSPVQSSAPPSLVPPLAQATTSTYTPTKLADPTKWMSTQDQTVAGQIQNLTDPNSPLIQQARSRAMQSANQRGLLNSSMAQTGADSAAYDAAMPIAQADAANASKIAGYNTDMSNQFAVKNQDTQTQVGLANMAARNQGSQFNTTQSNVAREQQVQQGFDLAKMDRQAALTISQMSQQQQNDMAQLAAKQGYNLETIDATQAADLARLAVQIEAQDKQALDKFGYDKQLVEIQRASNREIAGIEAQYKNLTQASASAASIMNNLSGNVARIMENTDLDATAKQKAIDIYNTNATKSLQLIGALSGDLDLATYLDDVLGTTTPAPETTLPPEAPTVPTVPTVPTTPTTPTNPYNPTPVRTDGSPIDGAMR